MTYVAEVTIMHTTGKTRRIFKLVYGDTEDEVMQDARKEKLKEDEVIFNITFKELNPACHV